MSAQTATIQSIAALGTSRFNNLRFIIVAERLGFARFNIATVAAGSYLFARALALCGNRHSPFPVIMPERLGRVIFIRMPAQTALM